MKLLVLWFLGVAFSMAIILILFALTYGWLWE